MNNQDPSQPSPISPTKRELLPEDFLTRAEKLKKKDIPSTSENSIIVRSNNEGLGFRFDCYPAQILSNILPKEIFDSTVKEANKICENAWTEKKKHENIDFHPWVTKIYYFAIFATFLGLLFLVIYMYSDSGFQLFPISFIFIGIGCLLMLVIAFISVLTEPNFTGLEKTIRTRLVRFLEEENNNRYRAKGFEWKIQKDFFWLELVNLNKRYFVEKDEIKFNFNK